MNLLALYPKILALYSILLVLYPKILALYKNHLPPSTLNANATKLFQNGLTFLSKPPRLTNTNLKKVELVYVTETNEMPKEQGLDHSFNFMTEGYMYILNRRKSFNSDVFETRLFGKRTICLGGEEATALFYVSDLFISNCSAV